MYNSVQTYVHNGSEYLIYSWMGNNEKIPIHQCDLQKCCTHKVYILSNSTTYYKFILISYVQASHETCTQVQNYSLGAVKIQQILRLFLCIMRRHTTRYVWITLGWWELPSKWEHFKGCQADCGKDTWQRRKLYFWALVIQNRYIYEEFHWSQKADTWIPGD